MTKNMENLGRYISILYRSGKMYINNKFEKYNIGNGQYLFLLSLSHNEGVTQEEMSCKLFIDKGTTAKAIKRLEDEGYVKRSVDDKDKRAYKVYLTEEGRKVTAEISEVLHDWNDILTSGFTEEEKGIALNLLQRMLENKNKQISKGECK
jgi:DNA-binding MarR family transcriptional regulator